MNYLKLFPVLALSALALLSPAPAKAQQYLRYSYSDVGTFTGGTNNVANGATNTYTSNNQMAAPLQEYLPIQIKYTFHTGPVGGTPSVTVRLQRSVDNSNWESAAPLHVLLANGATSTCTWVTNIDCKGIPYFRVNTVENTNSAVITNINIRYGTKR